MFIIDAGIANKEANLSLYQDSLSIEVQTTKINFHKIEKKLARFLENEIDYRTLTNESFSVACIGDQRFS